MEFLTIFGKVVAKNKAFGITSFFYNNFSIFLGGGRSLCFPLAAPMQSVPPGRSFPRCSQLTNSGCSCFGLIS